MVTVETSGIVLAGGRSSRFGAGKLATQVDGRPLLHHALDAVGQVSDEVIVVVAPGWVGEVPADALGAPVRVIRDATPHAGPLAGLRDGAAAASGERLIVVAGDMPGLRPAVLRMLVVSIDERTEAAILSPAPAPAPVQTLPLALARGPALAAATALLAADRRSLRALIETLATATIPAAIWRLLDPDGATLWDIDTPGDLPPR